MKKISNGLYSLEIPEGWEIERNEDGTTSIFNPNGTGAVTISSYSSLTGPPNAIKALEKFVKGKGSIKDKEVNQLDAAESEYEDTNENGPIFVYAVTISGNTQLLLVSYNCKKENFSQKELDEVKKIAETIKWE